MNHLQNRTFPLTTVEMPDNRAGDISEVKRACQPSLNDCLPLFKLNTIKTQTCNCGRAESDAVAIVWPDICNYGAEKNVICKMCSEWLRGRTFENMIWNPCVRSSFPSSRVWSLLTAGGHFQATGGWGRCDECLQNLNILLWRPRSGGVRLLWQKCLRRPQEQDSPTMKHPRRCKIHNESKSIGLSVFFKLYCLSIKGIFTSDCLFTQRWRKEQGWLWVLSLWFPLSLPTCLPPMNNER